MNYSKLREEFFEFAQENRADNTCLELYGALSALFGSNDANAAAITFQDIFGESGEEYPHELFDVNSEDISRYRFLLGAWIATRILAEEWAKKVA